MLTCENFLSILQLTNLCVKYTSTQRLSRLYQLSLKQFTPWTQSICMRCNYAAERKKGAQWTQIREDSGKKLVEEKPELKEKKC